MFSDFSGYASRMGPSPTSRQLLTVLIVILLAVWYTRPTKEQEAERARREYWQEVFGQKQPEPLPPWP